jgi:hypothetical protein
MMKNLIQNKILSITVMKLLTNTCQAFLIFVVSVNVTTNYIRFDPLTFANGLFVDYWT